MTFFEDAGDSDREDSDIITTDGRDYYTELLESSRWLRKEQADARIAWFNALSWEHKEKNLFRLEMLLKGLVCFGNPINHFGQSNNEKSMASKNFNLELDVVRSIVRNIVDSGRMLVGDKDNSFVFKRYLESVVVQDHTRVQMVSDSLNQDSPEQSLSLMLSAMQNMLEIIDGLVLNDHVSYKMYSAIIMLAHREICRSVYFDPLASFEFRTEFDRIRNVEILEVISSIRSDPARRVASLTLLALFRLMKYLDLVDSEDIKDAGYGPLLSFMTLFYTDGREVASFFKDDASVWMAEGFGRLYEKMEPSALGNNYDSLALEYEGLKSLSMLLESSGNQLQLELKRVFEQQIPDLETFENQDQLHEVILFASASLRSFLQNSIVRLAKEFSSEVDADKLFADFTSDRSQSERLRRDIWMFQQILRAFIAKAKGVVDVVDQWAGISTFQFVRQFVIYFKSMGYQLLRYSDYDRFDGFMELVQNLKDADVLDSKGMMQVVAECEDFNNFLRQMFEEVGKREEIANISFDRRDAARTLKLFLGH